MEVLAHNFGSFSRLETMLSMLSLALMIFFARNVKKMPGYIAALFVGTAAVVIFRLPVETIGTRFGGIPSGFPTFTVPHFHVDVVSPDGAGHHGRHAGRHTIGELGQEDHRHRPCKRGQLIPIISRL
jgi:hypothetical protein